MARFQRLIPSRLCAFKIEYNKYCANKRRSLAVLVSGCFAARPVLLRLPSASRLGSPRCSGTNLGPPNHCCGCCCGILRGITEWGIANSMARANYEAVVSEEDCIGCGSCTERCQVSAIALSDDHATVDRDRCLGCGLCVTTCPAEAVKLVPRPEAEQVKPPASFGEWEEQRLRNRGLL